MSGGMDDTRALRGVTGQSDGYAQTMRLAEERPDLLPLVKLIATMGDEAFNEGLDELIARGILDTVHRACIPLPLDRLT